MVGNTTCIKDDNLSWIVDIRTTNDMISNLNFLINDVKVGTTVSVQLPIGDSTHVTDVGDCILIGGNVINDVLCVSASDSTFCLYLK